jgi:hypothetical protein
MVPERFVGKNRFVSALIEKDETMLLLRRAAWGACG